MKKWPILLPLIAALVALAGFTIAQQKKVAADGQTAKITVTVQGFEPSSLTLKANVPAKITFLRTTNETCATSVVIPEYKIQKDLPLNQPVVVELTPKKGSFGFACGMGMLQGKLVVQ
jgi:plastocyanin domain-containing protein